LRYKKRKKYIVALLSENFIPSDLEIALFGEHNREGLCLVYDDWIGRQRNRNL